MNLGFEKSVSELEKTPYARFLKKHFADYPAPPFLPKKTTSIEELCARVESLSEQDVQVALLPARYAAIRVQGVGEKPAEAIVQSLKELGGGLALTRYARLSDQRFDLGLTVVHIRKHMASPPTTLPTRAAMSWVKKIACSHCAQRHAALVPKRTQPGMERVSREILCLGCGRMPISLGTGAEGRIFWWREREIPWRVRFRYRSHNG